jgi:hypothetical protein
MKTLLFLCCLCVSMISNAEIKTFSWGLESWLGGQQDFIIKINEKYPVTILAIDGYVTASPIASFPRGDNVSRQTLISLLNHGSDTPTPASVIVTYPNMNHGVSSNLMVINVKQTGDTSVSLPTTYRPMNLVVLPLNMLRIHLDNASYRAQPDGTGYVVNDFFSGLDVEIQWVVTYKTWEPGIHGAVR